ncbi:MAG TPA: metallophosphoesterase family protein [Paraburkholderia sp.]|uniref:metallophosphoesterase family protein n=1 Tax=Paraburkholderia sp. TaxID=1926495 RepID=UPI002CD97553|nr:metallophosphoesterase family protein [Paraburkholderia sp.]HTR10558.1 metallophosphoesterase family protein [Paraburkholderia sp.]
MRIQIASDLHLDALAPRFAQKALLEAAEGADLLVLAGDIHLGAGAVEIFSDWPVPVVYVSGNHEAYGSEYDDVVAAIQRRSPGTQVHYLERRSIEFGTVRFLGCCLWTDYALYGDVARSMDYAREAMSDHAAIRVRGGAPFGPEEALAEHRRAVSWLEEELARPFDGKTVVVTHHGVSPASIHPRFHDHPVNAGFLSDLRHLLARADLWIHGHVHDSFDYRHSKARVVANPRGYPLNLATARTAAQLQWENAAFDPACVVAL